MPVHLWGAQRAHTGLSRLDVCRVAPARQLRVLAELRTWGIWVGLKLRMLEAGGGEREEC